MPELSLFPAPRQQLEETWRLKLEQASADIKLLTRNTGRCWKSKTMDKAEGRMLPML
jgi:hypothetical protein